MKDQPIYHSIEAIILDRFEPEHRIPCMRILHENHRVIRSAPGSLHNHQAWDGGYCDHVTDGLNLLIVLYESLCRLRPLPFRLSSALLVYFLHDIEKPWKYESRKEAVPAMLLAKKEDRHEFRMKKIAEYGIKLTDEELNALQYTEGEGKDYSNLHRAMNELAAFCHMADVASARIWHDYPKESGRDEWVGAERAVG
ncbi:MAG TPA: hypothetical protein VFT82_02755 [Candidatus Paceibacterota bacterium]|nr:hypothetical protein [Candidatus Paceibacterota bacterium]